MQKTHYNQILVGISDHDIMLGLTLNYPWVLDVGSVLGELILIVDFARTSRIVLALGTEALINWTPLLPRP
jgi:hypothetical protein